MTKRERIEQLEREVRELQDQLAELQARMEAAEAIRPTVVQPIMIPPWTPVSTPPTITWGKDSTGHWPCPHSDYWIVCDWSSVQYTQTDDPRTSTVTRPVAPYTFAHDENEPRFVFDCAGDLRVM